MSRTASSPGALAAAAPEKRDDNPRASVRADQRTGVTLICDIEGLETDPVEHAGEVIERHCRTLVIEVHPEFRADEARARMFEALQWRGFRPVESLRKVHVHALIAAIA